jgi:hypothetical protein
VSKLLLIAAFAMAAAAACGKKSEDDNKAAPAATKTAGSGSTAGTASAAKKAALAGKIAGTAWTVASARAIPSEDEEPTAPYSLSFVSEKFAAPCQMAVFQADDKRRLELNAKIDKTGSYELGSDAKVQFLDESGSEVKRIDATAATLVIDSVTATTIKGSLTASADDTDSVTGAVSIAKCCPTEDGLAYEACTAN